MIVPSQYLASVWATRSLLWLQELSHTSFQWATGELFESFGCNTHLWWMFLLKGKKKNSKLMLGALLNFPACSVLFLPFISILRVPSSVMCNIKLLIMLSIILHAFLISSYEFIYTYISAIGVISGRRISFKMNRDRLILNCELRCHICGPTEARTSQC